MMEEPMEEECQEWLLKHLPKYLDLFVDQKFVKLEHIASIDASDLKDMGVVHVGPRKEILMAIKTLNAPSTPQPPTKPSSSKKLLQTSMYIKSIPRSSFGGLMRERWNLAQL